MYVYSLLIKVQAPHKHKIRKRSSIFHPGINGRPPESDKSGVLQVESDESTPFFHRIDFQSILAWQMLWSALKDGLGNS
jgi:hypothetical protein